MDYFSGHDGVLRHNCFANNYIEIKFGWWLGVEQAMYYELGYHADDGLPIYDVPRRINTN